jgi:hypothetical protein
MPSAADSSAAGEDVLVRRENGALIWPLGQGLERQRAYPEPVLASRDAAEGVAPFRERRDPKWYDQ